MAIAISDMYISCANNQRAQIKWGKKTEEKTMHVPRFLIIIVWWMDGCNGKGANEKCT